MVLAVVVVVLVLVVEVAEVAGVLGSLLVAEGVPPGDGVRGVDRPAVVVGEAPGEADEQAEARPMAAPPAARPATLSAVRRLSCLVTRTSSRVVGCDHCDA